MMLMVMILTVVYIYHDDICCGHSDRDDIDHDDISHYNYEQFDFPFGRESDS